MSKKELTKYQKITISIGIIGLIIGISALLGTQLELPYFTEDDDPVTIPDHTYTPPTNGETPTIPIYNEPDIISGELDPSEQTVVFTVSVTHPENVLSMSIDVETSDDESADIGMNEISTGKYRTSISRTIFSLVTDDTVLTIKIDMLYLDEDDNNQHKIEGGFPSFSFTAIPQYFKPEVLRNTFDFTPEDIIDYGFSTTYHDLILNIDCYFVIDDDIVEIGGEDYIYEVIHVGEGDYKSSIDRSVFEQDVDIFLYLKVDYLNETNENDFFLVKELAKFQNPSGIANGSGLNYLFVLIATMVALTILSINKMKKVKNK